MAASARDRATAIEYAEAGLDTVRQLLDVRYNQSFAVNTLATPAGVDQARQQAWPTLGAFTPMCQQRDPGAVTGDNENRISRSCFTQACNSGLCFTGDMAVATKAQCRMRNPNTGLVIERWKERAIWNDANRHGVLTVKTADDTDTDVQYLVEMLCFTNPSNQTIMDPAMANGVPLYRITTRATGDAGRATVMLQSVYKGNLF